VKRTKRGCRGRRDDAEDEERMQRTKRRCRGRREYGRTKRGCRGRIEGEEDKMTKRRKKTQSGKVDDENPEDEEDTKVEYDEKD